MTRASDLTGETSLTFCAPAKVNLFLEVLAKRPDGYHAIETLMVAVNLFDAVELVTAPELSLTCSDPALPTGPDNLVFRAAAALQHASGYAAGAKIHLTKRIPAAAGLAGGSSDAAATLTGLNQLWGLGLSRQRLAAIAAEVGSDVAFFLDPPVAWCTGRGEIVEPFELGATLHLVLVCPAEGLATADVYRGVSVPAAPRSGDAIRAAARAGDVPAIGRELFNRLQEPAEALSPWVRELRTALAGFNPLGCLMSGSGSTLFALCAGPTEANRLAKALRSKLPDPKPRVFVVRTCVKD